MQPARPDPSHSARPIHQKPSWLETILFRPIRVECWACLLPSWLHRNQRDSPSDWTCPHCLTHQRRDKDGNIVPVPEMFDGSLNSDTSERLARSRKNRTRPRMDQDAPQDDFFCDMCNGHQRVVYQLLSNYIPDEEDDNYEAYYDNADTYKRQLEERYPLACARCFDKVQKKLAQQNYRIKSSLLNATLSKSRGDKITPTRKYPTIGWLVTGASWLMAHTTLMSVEMTGIVNVSSLPNWRLFKLTKHLAGTAKTWALKDFWTALFKLHPGALLPPSSSFGRLFVDLSEEELSAVIIVALAVLSIAGLCWNPMDFAAQRTSRIRIRTRRYFYWAQTGAAPLVLAQFTGLFAGVLPRDMFWIYWALLILHALYLVTFLNGQYILEPLDVRLDGSGTSTPTSRALNNNNASLSDRHKSSPEAENATPVRSRSAVHLAEHSVAPQSPVFSDTLIGSRPGSPSMNEIAWSPKKPAPSKSAAFGMYRDPSQSTRQDDSAFRTVHQPGSTASTSNGHNVGKLDNKFRLRAYEPSPLANPSMVTDMNLGGMSLGEMFGFPSATFQPPENLFAHRSTGEAEASGSNMWSYRKTPNSGAFGQDRSQTLRNRSSVQSRFAEGADVDMDDEQDEFNGFGATSGLSRGRLGLDASDDNDHIASFGRTSLTAQARHGMTSNGHEAFAAQRFFPPEPETGLEDNFLGIVKIVDDYLPPQSGPRNIASRNLVLKKRAAHGWLALMLLCRALILWKANDSWQDSIHTGCQLVFVCVILHATAFWILDEYRAFRRSLDRNDKKPTSANKKARQGTDPFEPTIIDRTCSNVLFVSLLIRVMNMALALLDKLSLPHSSLTTENCSIQKMMDWSPRIIQWIAPSIEGHDVLCLAHRVGWVHDILTMALLIVLITCGARPQTKE